MWCRAVCATLVQYRSYIGEEGLLLKFRQNVGRWGWGMQIFVNVWFCGAGFVVDWVYVATAILQWTVPVTLFQTII